MSDILNNLGVHKSVETSKILIFVPDYVKTKKYVKVKLRSYLLYYDTFLIDVRFRKGMINNSCFGETLESVPDSYKN